MLPVCGVWTSWIDPQTFVWGYYIGGAITVSVLVVKNWRIYRIFHNERLKLRVKYLIDVCVL